MVYDLSSVYSLLSSIFRIPSTWFAFPAILTNLIIPFILVTYGFYQLFLRLHIFGYSTGIYLVLSAVFAFVLIPFGPLAAIAAAGFTAVVGLQGWKSRIVFVVILIFVYFIVIPYLSTIRF